jgi:hypothetical protein
MKPRVYIETTIISYLAARPSRDLIVAAHQQLTHDWWNDYRSKFDLVTSQLVVDEVSAGDQQVADRRLGLLEDTPLLEISDEVTLLAQRIVERKALSGRAAEDALHIAVATVHEFRRAHGRLKMWEDPIVEEVRRVREAHAKKFNFEIRRIVADVKERELATARVVIQAPRKQLAGSKGTHSPLP